MRPQDSATAVYERRPILSTPGYFADTDGAIWSSVRGGMHRLSCYAGNGHGHLKISVGRGRKQWAHILVCEAFHGRCPLGLECSHIDGCAGNNRPDNLCWETHAKNNARRAAHGTWGMKLTAEQVIEIRESYTGRRGEQSALGRKYGVTSTAIWYVVNDLTWGLGSGAVA